MGEELEGAAFPKAPRRTHKPLSKEKRLIGLEMAAMAYVAMENGDYVYPKGLSHPDKSDPKQIHRGELLRIAGYNMKQPAGREFARCIEDNEDFQQFLALHRLRRTDPMFRKTQENMLLSNIIGDAMRLIAERLHYYPHSVTTKEAVDVISRLLAAQGRVNPEKPAADDRASKLLDSLPAEQRKVALEGLKAKARADLASIESLEKAHAAVDGS